MGKWKKAFFIFINSFKNNIESSNTKIGYKYQSTRMYEIKSTEMEIALYTAYS